MMVKSMGQRERRDEKLKVWRRRSWDKGHNHQGTSMEMSFFLERKLCSCSYENHFSNLGNLHHKESINDFFPSKSTFLFLFF